MFPATVEEINCIVGTYNPNRGAKNVSDCIPCTAGWYCLEGIETPTGQCYAGFYCPSPIDNPYGDEPAEIGSYGPTQVRIPHFLVVGNFPGINVPDVNYWLFLPIK